MTFNNRVMHDDRRAAIAWAHAVFQFGNFVLLDTETTGRENDAEIVQITILGEEGERIFETLVKPTKAISAEAQAVHHITLAMVANAPTFPQVYARIQQAIDNKRVVIYNSQFDTRILEQCCRRYALPPFRFFDVNCAMLQYAAFVGERDWKHGGWKRQRLPSGDHSARGDCRAMLDVIRQMAKEWTP